MIRCRTVSIIICFVASATLTACGGGGSSSSGGGGSDGTTGTDAVIDQSATAIEDSTTAEKIEQVSSDGKTIVVSGTDTTFNDLQPGEVFAVKPTDSAPRGLLRKVVEVQEDGSRTTVETEQAALTEVIERGSIDETGTLTPPENAPSHASGVRTDPGRTRILHKAEGVRFIGAGSVPAAATISDPESKDFLIELDNVVLYDEDGDHTTTADQVVADGVIGFSVDYNFDMTVENFKLESMGFTITPSQTAQLELRSALAAEVDADKTLWSARLPAIKFAVGVWPIWVTPEIDVAVSAQGEVSASLTTGATGAVSATAGVDYASGRSTPWQPVAQRSADFEVMPVEVNTNASATVKAGPALQMLFYDAGGPKANVGGYVTLEADPLEDPWWRLLGGFQAGASVTVEVFDNTIAEAGFPDIIDYQIELAKAETGGLPVPNTPQDLQAESGEGQVELSWAAVNDASQYNVYWSNQTGVTPGGSGANRIADASSPFVHTGLESGTYYYVVEAENAAGTSQPSGEVSAMLSTSTGDDGTDTGEGDSDTGDESGNDSGYPIEDYWVLANVDKIVWATEDYEYHTFQRTREYPVVDGTISPNDAWVNFDKLGHGVLFVDSSGYLKWRDQETGEELVVLPERVDVDQSYEFTPRNSSGVTIKVEDHISVLEKTAHSGNVSVLVEDVLKLKIVNDYSPYPARSGTVFVAKGLGPVVVDTNNYIGNRYGVRALE